jgi:Tfp pilus assembly protein PilN
MTISNGSWEKSNVDENKFYKQAKEFWEKHFKGTMSFDVYMAQVYEKIKAYEVMPTEDKQKFIQSQIKLLDKATHEIKKFKEERYDK